jgi:hypothetical protein
LFSGKSATTTYTAPTASVASTSRGKYHDFDDDDYDQEYVNSTQNNYQNYYFQDSDDEESGQVHPGVSLAHTVVSPTPVHAHSHAHGHDHSHKHGKCCEKKAAPVVDVAAAPVLAIKADERV